MMEKMVEGKKKRVRKEPGPAVAILSGPQRAENDHQAILAAVMAGRQNRHGLVLVFRGEGVLGAWSSLELSDRLKEIVASGRQVVTMAECWLGVSDLLVWLQGTTRFMTESGYGYVKVPSFSRHLTVKSGAKAGEGGVAQLNWYEEAMREHRQNEGLNNPRWYAYEKLLDQLNEHLPVAEYANKVVPRADLVEMGLISHEGLDQSLAKGWPGETEMAEPDDKMGGRAKQPGKEQP